jgi:hypothetical protein
MRKIIITESQLKKIIEESMPSGKGGQTLSTGKNVGNIYTKYKGQKLKVLNCGKSIKINGNMCTKNMMVSGNDKITGSDNDKLMFSDLKGFGQLEVTIKGGMVTYSIYTD